MNKRMTVICKTIGNSSIVADVGCDHGKIGAFLLENNKADKVFFCDISKQSLQKAKILCEKFGDRAEFYEQDGLQSLCVDTAIIAGMGAMEILHIIKNAKLQPKNLLLQPMHSSEVLRQELSTMYKFEKDFLIYDGSKHYDIMKLSCGNDTFNQVELMFGKTNVTEHSADFNKYIKKEYAKCQAVLSTTYVENIAVRLKLIKELL
ncbi:MAG: class I SAM-dependent methyltransferase [Clostridia bacterium]